MPETKAPLIQVATLEPFIHAIEGVGISAVDLGASIGLTPELLGDPTALAPAASIYRFAERAAARTGDPHLGVRLGLDPAITQWPVIAEAFSQSRVMVEFFSRFLLESQKYTTNVTFDLKIGPEFTWFERDRGFAPGQKPAQIDGFAVGLFLSLFRIALGKHWSGSEMLFRVCDPDVVRVPEIGGCALVKGDSRALAFSFPSRWLVLPMRRTHRDLPPWKPAKPPSDALIAAIRSNIRSNIADPGFGVEKLVDHMGFDRRDVQKFLRDRGSGLSDLIETERKALACEWLTHGEHSLGEIAQSLGYTDVSNFSRAFQRWTGIAPSRWRNRKRQARPGPH